MAQKRNFQRELDAILDRETGRRPTLLLHSCCAPCSSYVLEYLSKYFDITLFYYNPNISPEEEYRRRAEEVRRLVAEMAPPGVQVIVGGYQPERFYVATRGLEDTPEGGERCQACFRLRLSEAAALAHTLGTDYYTTTLTISPLKSAANINAIGEELAPIYGTTWLPCDFKKREGYKRSIELSREYGLYRQDYCGCVFSRRARENRQKQEVRQKP